MSGFTEVEQAVIGEVMVREDNPVVDLTDRWLLRYRSKDTRRAYQNDLEMYLRWCDQRVDRRGEPAPIAPLTVKASQLDEYKAWLDASAGQIAGTMMAIATVNRKLSVLSSWFKYLVRHGVVAANPVDMIDRPRVDRESHTTGLTQAELMSAIAAAAIPPVIQGHATKLPTVTPLCQVAVVRFLAVVGCRVTELTALDVKDLASDSGHMVVVLRMKGGKMRRRVVPASLVDDVRAHHLDRAHQAGISVEELTGPMFADKQGGRLTRDVATGIVQRAARNSGLAHWRKITPHSFRHAWATLARQMGATLEERQYALGHTNATTTQRYDRAAASLERDPSHLIGAALAPDPVDALAV